MIWVDWMRFNWWARRHRRALIALVKTAKFRRRARSEATTVVYLGPDSVMTGVVVRRGQLVMKSGGVVKNLVIEAGGSEGNAALGGNE